MYSPYHCARNCYDEMDPPSINYRITFLKLYAYKCQSKFSNPRIESVVGDWKKCEN